MRLLGQTNDLGMPWSSHVSPARCGRYENLCISLIRDGCFRMWVAFAVHTTGGAVGSGTSSGGPITNANLDNGRKRAQKDENVL